MRIEEVLEALKQRGHQINGPAAISHDGFILVNIDGTLMRYVEARELLLDETEREKRRSVTA